MKKLDYVFFLDFYSIDAALKIRKLDSETIMSRQHSFHSFKVALLSDEQYKREGKNINFTSKFIGQLGGWSRGQRDLIWEKG